MMRNRGIRVAASSLLALALTMGLSACEEDDDEVVDEDSMRPLVEMPVSPR